MENCISFLPQPDSVVRPVGVVSGVVRCVVSGVVSGVVRPACQPVDTSLAGKMQARTLDGRPITDTNKKEPLLLKRFMGYAEQPPRDGRFRTAIDSASQKISVTVRQMFSADPAGSGQNPGFLLRRSPLSRCAACWPCEAVLMNPAPLSN